MDRKKAYWCLRDYAHLSIFNMKGNIYQHSKWINMSSSISELLAEALLHRTEKIILPLINPKLWIRFLKDIFVTYKQKDIGRIHIFIEIVFLYIKLLRGKELNENISYLDVLLRRNQECSFKKKRFVLNHTVKRFLVSIVTIGNATKENVQKRSSNETYALQEPRNKKARTATCG